MEFDGGFWLKVLAAAAAIFALPVVRWVVAQVKVWRHATRDKAAVFALLPDQINQLTQQVEKILVETHPNGGLTIRDALMRIEARQIKHEQRWRALMSDMKTGMFEADKDGKLVWANRALMRISGRSFPELEGFGWFGCIVKEERTTISDEYLVACKHQREIEIAFRVTVSRGDPLLVNLRSFRLCDVDSEIVGYINVVEPYRNGCQT